MSVRVSEQLDVDQLERQKSGTTMLGQELAVAVEMDCVSHMEGLKIGGLTRLQRIVCLSMAEAGGDTICGVWKDDEERY